MSKNLPAEIHIPEIDADFLLIPAGAFFVGEKENRRLAVITRPFYMQETTVTQLQYEMITGKNPADFKDNPDNPVEQVNWNDSVVFAKNLSQQTKLTFRLPTEVEWEYAARGGDGDKYTYAGSNDLDEVAWIRENSGLQPRPVRQKKPNGYGLYDMSGNVWEWCSDVWNKSYPNRELIDYKDATPSGSTRVSRGGSWCSSAVYARVAFRYWNNPDHRDDSLGFRLVLETI